MILLRDLAKAYRAGPSRKVLFDGLSAVLPAGARVALLGRNGAGKTTLLNIIAGTARPDTGRVTVQGRVSWPIGFAGGFAADMTGTQNVRFVARVYGAPTDDVLARVRDFAELGPFLDMPVRTYSAGMRARLAFGLSMGIAFDWYLVDEVAAVGDAAFRAKSLAAFRGRLAGAGLVMVSHAMPLLRDFCDCGLVLSGGRAEFHPDLDTAIARHEALLAA